MTRRFATLLLSVVAGMAAAAANAGERIAGPVPASVVRAIDGDTLVVAAHIWVGIDLTTHVRIRGIDTPETHQPKCASEKAMGLEATDRLAALAGGEVLLADIENDKYGGRVDAAVTTAAGVDLGAAMVASGLARPYDGSARGDWCATGSIR